MGLHKNLYWICKSNSLWGNLYYDISKKSVDLPVCLSVLFFTSKKLLRPSVCPSRLLPGMTQLDTSKQKSIIYVHSGRKKIINLWLCIQEGKTDFEVSKIDLCIQERRLSRKRTGGPQSVSHFNSRFGILVILEELFYQDNLGVIMIAYFKLKLQLHTSPLLSK